jgi:hypothetical protein
MTQGQSGQGVSASVNATKDLYINQRLKSHNDSYVKYLAGTHVNLLQGQSALLTRGFITYRASTSVACRPVVQVNSPEKAEVHGLGGPLPSTISKGAS